MDICRPRSRARAQQQTNCTMLLLSIDGTDRRTDRRMDTAPLRRRSLLEASSVNNTPDTVFDFSRKRVQQPRRPAKKSLFPYEKKTLKKYWYT